MTRQWLMRRASTKISSYKPLKLVDRVAVNRTSKPLGIAFSIIRTYIAYYYDKDIIVTR